MTSTCQVKYGRRAFVAIKTIHSLKSTQHYCVHAQMYTFSPSLNLVAAVKDTTANATINPMAAMFVSVHSPIAVILFSVCNFSNLQEK